MAFQPKSDFLSVMIERGYVADCTDYEALDAALVKGIVPAYIGYDATAASLHVGHLLNIMMLRWLQKTGHKPITLMGGGTTKVGDPSFRSEERPLLTPERIDENIAGMKQVFSRYLSYGEAGNGALMLNNAEWLDNLNYLEFLRDIGKHFSLSTMLGRETVKRRLENDGISYTEFSYMLLQANDFVQLRRNHDCVLQIGGGDQWGNLVAGVDLNRRMDGAQVHALTVPLVTDSEGKKFGKSTGGGSLWLDPEMTSPYTWYQYFVNTADADVIRYLRWFTFLDQEELERLETEVAERPFKREAQRRLAQEMTDLVHGREAREAVELASQALFGRAELTDLDEATLAAAVSETDVFEFSAGDQPTIVDLLVGAGLADSKGAARRSIKEGGVYVNNQRIEDESWAPEADDLLHGSWLVLRRGKKNFAGAKRV